MRRGDNAMACHRDEQRRDVLHVRWALVEYFGNFCAVRDVKSGTVRVGLGLLTLLLALQNFWGGATRRKGSRVLKVRELVQHERNMNGISHQRHGTCGGPKLRRGAVSRAQQIKYLVCTTLVPYYYK